MICQLPRTTMRSMFINSFLFSRVDESSKKGERTRVKTVLSCPVEGVSPLLALGPLCWRRLWRNCDEF